MLLFGFSFGIFFKDFPTMLINNKPPIPQLIELTKIFRESNIRLSELFLFQKDPDPFILDVLQDNVCNYLTEETDLESCDFASKGGKIGLLNLMIDFSQSAEFYRKAYMVNPSLENAMLIAPEYITNAYPDLVVMNAIIPKMIKHIMSLFLEKIEKMKRDDLKFFIGIITTIIISLAFFNFVAVKRLKRGDLTRRKILKIIPYTVFHENRALSYYLRLNFNKEVETIRNLL